MRCCRVHADGPFLPHQQAGADLPQDQVHDQGDAADADDADIDDIEQEIGRGVLDHGAEPALGGDQFGCHQRRPGHAQRHAQRGQDMRHGQRNDDLAEDLEFAGAERLRDADIERRDLRDALIHHDHAGEKRGVKQDHELCDFIDPEIDDHQRDQRDRRQRAKEIDHGIGEGARRPIPAQQETDGNGDENAERDAEEYPPRRSIDVEQQAFMQQQFDEFGRDLMRRRDQRGVDEPAPAHAVPERHGADPWREPQ